VNAADVNLRLK